MGEHDGEAPANDPFHLKNRFGGIGVIDDPHPHLHELRAQCPVHPGSVSGSFGMVGPDNYIFPEERQVTVLSYDLADAGFRNHGQLSNSYYIPYLREVIGRTILEMDPPEQLRYRQLIQGAFTKAEMQRWEDEFARTIVSSYLDKLAPLGRGDLAEDFAFHYPIAVTAAAVGLGIDRVEEFYEQATLLTNVSVPVGARLAAAADLGELVSRLIVERRADPQQDLISVLTQAKFRNAGDRTDTMLTDGEIIAFVRLLVPAGAQTTYRTLTTLLYALLTHPEQMEAIRNDRSLIPQAIEEALRWDGPLLSFARVATEDITIGGVDVPEGDVVNLCVNAANRDPARWDNPDEFDIFRAPQAHLSFGMGAHTCLGVHFARMELRVAVELVLDRLPNLRLDPEAGDDVRVGGLYSRAAVRLPCVWDVPATSTNPSESE